MYRHRRVIIFERNSTIEVAVCHHENNFIQRLGNVFKINFISVYRSVFRQNQLRLPFVTNCRVRNTNPKTNISFMAYAIDKHAVLGNCSIHLAFVNIHV